MHINFCTEAVVYQEPRLLDCSTNLQKVTNFDPLAANLLSLCWGSVLTKRGELSLRLNKQTRFQYIIILIKDRIPIFHNSYYVAILFAVPGHQRFNSLNRSGEIRDNVARRPQTVSYFVLVISRTDLLSQIKYLFFNYLIYRFSQG